MNEIHILGRYPVYGELMTQGSKNAVLPLMAASLLHAGTTVLEHVPDIADVDCMVRILKGLGAVVTREGERMTIDASCLSSWEISLEDVTKMRSSIMVLGPLVARMGQAATYYPGGCSIGKRPVDYHIRLLRDLGVRVREEDGHIDARAERYRGAMIRLEFPSVGATENAILAATGATGETVICGCAREPEILELCLFLRAMGIETMGAGTDMIWVRGQKSSQSPWFRVSGDRIAAGTYLAAAAVTGGEIRLQGAPVQAMKATLQALCACGCRIQTEGDRIDLTSPRHLRRIPYLETSVYPGFPTDMQSILLTVQCCGTGEGMLKETIFEGRFETAAELKKMGAHIDLTGCEARVYGDAGLKGAAVAAHDLRGGAALVVAGLGAVGETVISECHHIARGYDDMVTNLQKLGAQIRWANHETRQGVFAAEVEDLGRASRR